MSEVTRLSMALPKGTTKISTCTRTTLVDIFCTSTTTKEVKIKDPRPRSKADEASGHFIYKKPSTITMNSKVIDPTPMQRMRARGQKKARNDAFIAERDEFFARLREEKDEKELVEYESAVMIQAAFRGFRRRPRPETTDADRTRYARLPPSVVEINNELCKWQSMLELKPIPGLTLVAHGHNARRQHRFEFAASIRIQCFFRMIHSKLRVMRKRRQRDASKAFSAACTITNFIAYAIQRLRKQRMDDLYKHHAAIQIQNIFRIFSARRFVRKVNRMRRHALRTNDAAVRLQRTFRKAMEEKRAKLKISETENLDNFYKCEIDESGEVFEDGISAPNSMASVVQNLST